MSDAKHTVTRRGRRWRDAGPGPAPHVRQGPGAADDHVVDQRRSGRAAARAVRLGGRRHVGLDANSTPASKDIVAGIETVAPLFHLLNGDLCYADLDVDRVRTWNNFFTDNTRSARFRPWMPAAGNHEIERRNGPIGLDAFQTYFKVLLDRDRSGTGRPVVLVHGRFGARDRAAERRRLPPGRR